MNGVFSGIQAILDSILVPIKFIGSIIQWTNNLLTIIIQAVVNVISLIATLPEWLTLYATTGLIVIILYLLLGRTTGK